MITDAQYSTLKRLLLASLADSGVRLGEAVMLRFFSRFFAASPSASRPSAPQSEAMLFVTRALLADSSFGPRSPQPDELNSFFSRLAADSLGYPWMPDPDYQRVSSVFRSLISDNGSGQQPTESDLLGHITSVTQGDGLPLPGFIALTAAHNAFWRDTKKFTVTGVAPNQYVAHDQGARLMLRTFSRAITIRAVATTGNSALGDTVDVLVNGLYHTTAQFPDAVGNSVGVNSTVVVNLPDGLKTVELIEQNCFVTGITCTGTIVPAPRPKRSLFAIGASGTQGFFSWDTADTVGGRYVFVLSYLGRVFLTRRFDSVYRIGNGGFGISAYGVNDPASALAFVDATVAPRCDGTIEQVILYEFCAGEQIANVTDPDVFAQKCSFLADATHARLPSARVLFQTAVFITNPSEATPNGRGFTMQAYRDALPPIAVTRPWVTIVDGLQMADSAPDLLDGRHMVPGDSTHPIGQVKAFNHLMTVFGGQQS